MPRYPTNDRRRAKPLPAPRPGLPDIRRPIPVPKPANDPGVPLPKPANDPGHPSRRGPVRKPPRFPFRPRLPWWFSPLRWAHDWYYWPDGDYVPRDPSGQWFVRHGPNTYPPPYARPWEKFTDKAYWSGSLANNGPYGPNTGKITGQAIGGPRLDSFSQISSSKTRAGLWILNDNQTRWAQHVAFQKFSSGVSPHPDIQPLDEVFPYPVWPMPEAWPDP